MSKPQRLTGPDALRGFALWGICVVNLPLIARSWQSYAQPISDDVARTGFFVNSWFFEAKFFGLFSFLFGFGIYLMLTHSRFRYVLRRLIGLFVLGLLHAILLFPGDILASYAVLGLIFLFLRNLGTSKLLVIAIVSFLLSIGTFFVLGHASGADMHIPATNYLGNFQTAIASNAIVYPITIGYVMLFNWPLAFAMFCLGYVAARHDLLASLAKLRYSWLTLTLGLAGSLPYAWAAAYKLKHAMVWVMPLMAFTSPLLSLSYARYVMLAAEGSKSLIITGLVAAGKMSLSNYLLQSLLAGVIFHGYGLAFYDRLSYAGLLAVSTGIFVFQVLFSLGWLKLFPLGPAEWLLRFFSHADFTARRR